jgi:hypothetical protein
VSDKIRAEIQAAAHHFGPGGNTQAGNAAMEDIVRTHGAKAVAGTVQSMKAMDDTVRKLRAVTGALSAIYSTGEQQ